MDLYICIYIVLLPSPISGFLLFLKSCGNESGGCGRIGGVVLQYHYSVHLHCGHSDLLHHPPIMQQAALLFSCGSSYDRGLIK